MPPLYGPPQVYSALFFLGIIGPGYPALQYPLPPDTTAVIKCVSVVGNPTLGSTWEVLGYVGGCASSFAIAAGVLEPLLLQWNVTLCDIVVPAKSAPITLYAQGGIDVCTLQASGFILQGESPQSIDWPCP